MNYEANALLTSKLIEMLEEIVAECWPGPDPNQPRLDYFDVQLSKDVYERARALIAEARRSVPPGGTQEEQDD